MWPFRKTKTLASVPKIVYAKFKLTFYDTDVEDKEIIAHHYTYRNDVVTFETADGWHAFKTADIMSIAMTYMPEGQ